MAVNVRHETPTTTEILAPQAPAEQPQQSALLAEVAAEVRDDAVVMPDAYLRETRVPADGE